MEARVSASVSRSRSRLSRALASSARAEVSEAEAARLDGELTPMGAERAGNAAGTIPAWTGGITAPPAGYVSGEREIDPYPDDRSQYTISAADIDAHADVLSDGQKALLRAYPEILAHSGVPTRRSASFPDWVYAAVRENATRARVVLEGKGSVAGARVGPPFPIPKSGLEVIWNHNLRWRGARVARTDGSAAVTHHGRVRGRALRAAHRASLRRARARRLRQGVSRTSCSRCARSCSRRRACPETPRS